MGKERPYFVGGLNKSHFEGETFKRRAETHVMRKS